MSSIERRRNAATGVERWRVRYRHGGRHQATSFATEAGAVSWKALLDTLGAERALAVLDQSADVTAARTVAEQVRHHIEHLTGVEDGTRRKYGKIAAARLGGDFERVLLADLTRDHVASWVNSQEGSPKTIRNAHSLLSGALGSAVRDGLVGANVAKGVRMPSRSITGPEHVFLTPGQFKTLHDALPAHWQPFVLFLVGTGVRFNEATALPVRHVDLTTGSARIWQAWKDSAGGVPVLGKPKTRRSTRTIALPPMVVAMLAEQIRGKGPDDFVFVNTRGTPIRNGSFHTSPWGPAVADLAGDTRKPDGTWARTGPGPRPRVHDLRHTYASWALRSHPIHVVQRQLGHESIQTTVDTYGHMIRSDLDALALSVDTYLQDDAHAPAEIEQSVK